MPAFRVKLGADVLNCVDVPLNPNHVPEEEEQQENYYSCNNSNYCAIAAACCCCF